MSGSISKVQHPKFKSARYLDSKLPLSALLCLSLSHLLPALAATNSSDADEIPPLSPPRGEIPPGFWEQYGAWAVLGGAVLLVAVLFFIWRLTRPKPPIIVPIET